MSYTKTLRVKEKEGWTTKPPEDLPENRLSAEDVDSNFLALEDQVEDKADKVSGHTTDNFAGLDATGNIQDSGSKAADFESSGTAAGLMSTHEDKQDVHGLNITAEKTLTVTESATLDEAVALSDKATLDTDVSFTSVDLGGDIETTALEYVIAEAKDASDNVVAKIAIEFDDLGEGTQNGVMRFYVQRAGTLTNVLELDGGV